MSKLFEWIKDLIIPASPTGWRESSQVTRLPVNQTGPFIPPFISRPEFVPAKLGVIWCGDHSRPLGWREYIYWETYTLPLGWSVIEPPDEGAMVPGERWRNDAAAT